MKHAARGRRAALSEYDRRCAELQARIERVHEERRRLTAIVVAERQRVQRDLHDGLQGPLQAAAALLALGQDRIRSGTGRAEAAAAIRKAAAQLHDVASSIDDVTRHIYPQILADQGLGAALATLCARSPVPVSLTIGAGEFPLHAAFTAYYVVAECLINVRRHAEAGEASVEVRASGGRLRVVVADDGRGMAGAGPQSGLSDLRDRVTAVGGTFEIDSGRTGTRVHASIPLGPD